MHTIRHAVTAAALAALVALAQPAGAQDRQSDENAFRWTGAVPAGRWVRVHNINGEVTVQGTSGSRVEVRAVKSWRRGNPEEVRIQARTLGDGSVVVCALYSDGSTCEDDGIRTPRGNRRSRNNDTNVRFQVLVPRDVRVDANTVNGSVAIEGATGEVRVQTVNGSVRAASSGGPVAASTVNGSIRVRMGRNDPGTPLEYETVNGSIVVEFPGNLDADVELETVNGHLYTDYPVTLQGRMNPRHMRATIGKGGQRIKLNTVNGNVELRRVP